MGAVFSVDMDVKIKQDQEMALLNAIISGTTESRINYMELKGLDTYKLEDVLAYYFTAYHNEWVDIRDGRIKINTGFDAGYSWELVMMDIFELMGPYLEDGSELYIQPDDDYDLLVIENGNVVYKH